MLTSGMYSRIVPPVGFQGAICRFTFNSEQLHLRLLPLRGDFNGYFTLAGPGFYALVTTAPDNFSQPHKAFIR